MMLFSTNRDFPFLCTEKSKLHIMLPLSVICESLVSTSCQAVNELYVGAVKCRLVVHKTNSNDLV